MLTRLRFKNWRSLRDVTIDNLTPITVFVGANSSGKTNILDALHFMRYAIDKGVIEAVYAWRGFDKIHTLGAGPDEDTKLEFTFTPDTSHLPLTYALGLNVDKQMTPFWFREQILKDDIWIWDRTSSGQSQKDEDGEEILVGLAGYFAQTNKKPANPDVQTVIDYVTKRWQLLKENFMPSLSLPAGDPGNLFVIEPYAQNLPTMLDFIHKVSPKTFNELQSDLKWLLEHVDKLNTQSDERETRISLHEKIQSEQEAASISSGTARIIAILTALYVTKWRLPKMPSLLVIEEPELSVHPLLLRNFVELLRLYTEDNPLRQVMLTTHNPMLLNLFKPEEVRIVERDEQGETTISPVSQEVLNVAFEKYGDYRIGDVWTTRVLGGVPE